MAADSSVVDAVVVIQAQVRGFLVRRKLLEVRKEFEEVLKEIERDTKSVQWKKEIGMPLVTSDSKVLNNVNENANDFSSTNGYKVARKQEVLREGLGSDSDDDDGSKLVTEEHSPANETLGGLRTHQVSKQRSMDNEGAAKMERPPSSLRSLSLCDDDFYRNQELPPDHEMEASHKLHHDEESTHPAKRSLGRVEENLGLDADERECVCADDTCRCSHKRTFRPSDFPLSSTINPVLSNEEIKETTEHNNASQPSLQRFASKRPYLRDQALLSESWMSDRSFDPVEVDKTPFPDLPTDPVKLHKLRDHIRMELLWTEQAIQSRKKYLGLRMDLSHTERSSDSTISGD